jgi:hypothetical protein
MNKGTIEFKKAKRGYHPTITHTDPQGNKVSQEINQIIWDRLIKLMRSTDYVIKPK